jgi:protein-S-isoprenylcysteine O-methyltransferase Ste14
VFSDKLLVIGLEILAIILGIWTFQAKKFSISAFPEPTINMKLITKGPYKYIRHPMYLAVLLATLGWVVGDGVTASLAWLLLLVVLNVKIHLEEKLLESEFKSYKKYQDVTWRLIPYIY